MKTPQHHFVLIMVGTLPPDTDLATASATLLSAVSVNMPMSTCMRGTFAQTTDEDAIALGKRLSAEVVPIPTRPAIVT